MTYDHVPMSDSPRRRSGVARLALALCGLSAALGMGLTAAAYTDHAVLNLGTGSPGSGIGDPRRFDIAIQDAAGTFHDAQNEADAVVLPSPSGLILTEDAPITFEAVVLNRDTSITGDLLLRVYDPGPAQDDLWDQLRFTIVLDDTSSPALTDATPAEVNSADVSLVGLAPGETRTVQMSVRLAAGSAERLAGSSTEIGLRFDGESR